MKDTWKVRALAHILKLERELWASAREPDITEDSANRAQEGVALWKLRDANVAYKWLLGIEQAYDAATQRGTIGQLAAERAALLVKYAPVKAVRIAREEAFDRKVAAAEEAKTKGDSYKSEATKRLAHAAAAKEELAAALAEEAPFIGTLAELDAAIKELDELNAKYTALRRALGTLWVQHGWLALDLQGICARYESRMQLDQFALAS